MTAFSKRHALTLACALLAASQALPGSADKIPAPGLYYPVREAMTKDLEAASFLEVLPGGKVHLAKKITRECFAAEIYGRIEAEDKRFRILVDSSVGDPDSSRCVSQEGYRREKRTLPGSLRLMGDGGFRLCLGTETKCREGSPAFVEYSRAEGEAKNPFR